MTTADLRSLAFERAPSLEALCARVGELSAEGRKFVLLAGGTDWMVEQELRAPFATLDAASLPQIVDVSQLAELRGITLAQDGDRDVLRIGAGTPYLALRRSELVVRRAPLLAAMARDVGAVQIQARGTLGGNLATGSPAGDGVAALAAYDAIAIVRSTRGERAIPIGELYTGYKQTTRASDEVFVAILLPLPREGSPSYWRKIGTRRAQAISKVALAGVAELEAGQVTRCGLGMASVGPTTSMLARTREALLSERVDRLAGDVLDKAVEADIAPIDDVRSTRAYRLHVAKAAVRDFARTLGARV
jgi:CO/xanthine dehydrogenase FAD-binding subunit